MGNPGSIQLGNFETEQRTHHITSPPRARLGHLPTPMGHWLQALVKKGSNSQRTCFALEGVRENPLEQAMMLAERGFGVGVHRGLGCENKPRTPFPSER